MIADQASLQAAGCFNDKFQTTSYDQTIELLATRRTAMAVNGTWIAPQIQAANPSLELGLFPLPYAAPGQQIQIPTTIAPIFAAPASTQQPKEAKQYLEFLARPDVMPLILKARGELPVMNNVVVTHDPPLAVFLSEAKTNSREVFSPGWPLAARAQFYYGIMGLSMGDIMPDAFPAATDKALAVPYGQDMPESTAVDVHSAVIVVLSRCAVCRIVGAASTRGADGVVFILQPPEIQKLDS